MEKKYKLAILASHPVTYHVPIFRKLAKHPRINLTVYFCSDFGVKKADFDPGFGRKIKWDLDLLSGYKYKFLKNYSLNPNPSTFFGLINPGIIRELLKNKYDAIIVYGYFLFTNWLAFLGAWLTKTPIIFRGETDLLKKDSAINKIVKKTLVKALFKKINAFLYSCSKNKEFYKNSGVQEKKLFFYPCAVDNEFFQKKAKELKQDKVKIKKKLKIPKDVLVILFVAKLIARKRPIDLIKAYELLPKYEKNKIYILYVGDGPERKKIKNYIKKKKLKNILFVGFKNQSELSAYYAIADIFVLPSEYDPSPKVMNEAMNFGLPIITTNKVGTAYDLIRNGKNGFIYPVGDVKKLSNCILKLIKNPELIKKMGIKSLETVSKWNFDKDIESIINVLDNL